MLNSFSFGSNVGIYCILSPSDKAYIGQSRNIKNRFKKYRSNACKDQPRLYNSFKKHGVEKHSFAILMTCREDINQSSLNYLECLFIDQFKERHELLNIKDGGSYGKHSKETCEKISLSHKGKPKSEEHILKIKNRVVSSETKKLISENHADFSGDKHPQYGRIHTESAKKLIGAANSRYIRTKEHKEKTSKSLLGRPCPMKGKKHSEQSRKNMGDSHKKPVVQYSMDGTFIKIWPSAIDASKALNTSNIAACCRGVNKSAAGFIFKYQ